jgi:hypothetical protein
MKRLVGRVYSLIVNFDRDDAQIENVRFNTGRRLEVRLQRLEAKGFLPLQSDLSPLQLLLFGPAAEEQGTVGAAEAEGVRHGVFEICFSGVVGDEVHAVGLGVLIFEVDGGRQNLIAQCEHRYSRL